MTEAFRSQFKTEFKYELFNVFFQLELIDEILDRNQRSISFNLKDLETTTMYIYAYQAFENLSNPMDKTYENKYKSYAPN